MNTICAKTNPAFKRAQLLPVILSLLPPTTSGTARHFPEFTPSATAKDRAHQISQQRQFEQAGPLDK
jgi:hypothetical protein